MISTTEKLAEFRENILDRTMPLELDEVLRYIKYIYSDDKKVGKRIDTYVLTYYRICKNANKYTKIKEIIKEDVS